MLLKCLCWVGGSQGVPFLTFTPNSYGRKVRIAKTQPQVGKEAPHFAVLSINIWPGNSFCEHNPVVSASEFFLTSWNCGIKVLASLNRGFTPCLLKKKIWRTNDCRYVLREELQPGHSVDFERCPQVSLSTDNLWVSIIHFTGVETL